jgi:hypothetical protein
MKSASLIALATFLWMSVPSAKATNLLTHTGWMAQSGTWTETATTATFGRVPATYEQNFPTTPGTNYIVEFEARTTLPEDDGAGVEALVSTSTNGLAYSGAAYATLAYAEIFSTTFTQYDFAFVATSGSATITIDGADAIVDLAATSVSAGTFSKPGKYSGTITITKALTSAGISSSHTDSVVADITPSGAMYAISQPSEGVLIGGFLNSSTFIYGAKSTPATLSGNSLSFSIPVVSGTATDAYESTPETESYAVSLTFQ